MGGALAAGGGPGSRLARRVAGALLSALTEAAAAALPLRLQKAPESDSNLSNSRVNLAAESRGVRSGTPPPAPYSPVSACWAP